MATLKQERTPLQKAKGAVKNLTYSFNRFKQKEQDQQNSFDPQVNRFRPLKGTFLSSIGTNGLQLGTENGGTYSGLSSPQENEKIGGDNVKLLPMSTKASSNEDNSIEYGKRFLPPIWVDIQEEIERHLEEIDTKMNELKKLQQKRLKVNFLDDDDDESTNVLQKQINTYTSDITDLVRASDSKLKELIKCQSEDKYDEQSNGVFDLIYFVVRKNIQLQLASKLKDITLKLRKREKKHYIKVSEIHDESGLRELKSSHGNMDRFINDDSQMQVLEEEEELDSTQRVRNKEIKNLVNTINDLAVLFKDLSVLVVEQGTILDRIDYNVECAHKDVVQANVHLEKTIKIEKSFRSKGVLICLVTSIIVCLLLLVIKHS